MKMMMSQKIILALVATCIAACEYSKEPVEGLSELREHAREDLARGPNIPREVIVNNDQIKEVKVVEVVQNYTANDISINVKDPILNFTEGKKGSFSISVSPNREGVEASLEAQNLPEGASFKGSQKEGYVLSWTPSFYTVPSGNYVRDYKVKLVARIVKAKTDDEMKVLSGFVKETTVSVLLYQDAQKPTEIKHSLKTEVSEGTETDFKVTAKILGIDGKAPVPPHLKVYFDGTTVTPGNNYQESDGTRYVISEKPIYKGDFIWEFPVKFNTKSIKVNEQLKSDGTLMVNATGSRVRFSLAVGSPLGPVSNSALVQVLIKLKPKAAVVPPPVELPKEVPPAAPPLVEEKPVDTSTPGLKTSKRPVPRPKVKK